jgi:putative ATP-binding cassette transporter
MFLPQRPHLGRGPFRQQLAYGLPPEGLEDGQLLNVVRDLGLEGVLERVGGLDAERDWGQVLSLGEQQLLGAGRLLLARPRFAFLEDATSALDPEKQQRLYRALGRAGITYVTVAADPGLLDYHEVSLEIAAEGTWELSPRAKARIA